MKREAISQDSEVGVLPLRMRRSRDSSGKRRDGGIWEGRLPLSAFFSILSTDKTIENNFERGATK